MCCKTKDNLLVFCSLSSLPSCSKLAKMFIRVCWQNLNKLFGLPKIYVGCNSAVVLTIELSVLWILDTGERWRILKSTGWDWDDPDARSLSFAVWLWRSHLMFLRHRASFFFYSSVLTGVDFALEGHWAMSGDILTALTTWRGGCYRHLVSSSHGCC